MFGKVPRQRLTQSLLQGGMDQTMICQGEIAADGSQMAQLILGPTDPLQFVLVGQTKGKAWMYSQGNVSVRLCQRPSTFTECGFRRRFTGPILWRRVELQLHVRETANAAGDNLHHGLLAKMGGAHDRRRAVHGADVGCAAAWDAFDCTYGQPCRPVAREGLGGHWDCRRHGRIDPSVVLPVHSPYSRIWHCEALSLSTHPPSQLQVFVTH